MLRQQPIQCNACCTFVQWLPTTNCAINHSTNIKSQSCELCIG